MQTTVDLSLERNPVLSIISMLQRDKVFFPKYFSQQLRASPAKLLHHKIRGTPSTHSSIECPFHKGNHVSMYLPPILGFAGIASVSPAVLWMRAHY